jgi:hypothetical protein
MSGLGDEVRKRTEAKSNSSEVHYYLKKLAQDLLSGRFGWSCRQGTPLLFIELEMTEDNTVKDCMKQR